MSRTELLEEIDEIRKKMELKASEIDARLSAQRQIMNEAKERLEEVAEHVEQISGKIDRGEIDRIDIAEFREMERKADEIDKDLAVHEERAEELRFEYDRLIGYLAWCEEHIKQLEQGDVNVDDARNRLEAVKERVGPLLNNR